MSRSRSWTKRCEYELLTLVHDNVGVLLDSLWVVNQSLQEYARCHECDLGHTLGASRLHSDMISDSLSNSFSKLLSNPEIINHSEYFLPLSDVYGCDPAGLGTNYFALSLLEVCLFKEIFRYLCSLSAASITRNNHDTFPIYLLEYPILLLSDRQL